jgi:hypothetical protein
LKPKCGIFTPVNELNTSPAKKRVEIRHHPQKIIISLWLDDYENFFSDFDPRPFSQRALSDDFLYEAKKVTHEMKPGIFDVTFLVPHNKRNKTEEGIIKARLQAHFKKQYTHLEREHKTIVRKGILLTILGFLLMIAGIASMHLSQFSFFYNYIRVILEPSGWFTAWYGLDHIFYLSKDDRHEMAFNKRMAHADFRFDAY